MEGDFRRLRGDRDKKSVPHCIVHACMNGLFFLTTELHQKYIKITSLLRQIAGVQQNYIKSTSKVHHFYVTFTSFYVRSDLWTIRTSAPLPGPPARAENGFPAVPATPHGHAINCAPVHRFLLALVQILSHPAWIQAKIARESVRCIVMHRAENLSARFWRVFGWFVACFTGFPSETLSEPLRRCTQRMLW